jgi:hypothetical protein
MEWAKKIVAAAASALGLTVPMNNTPTPASPGLVQTTQSGERRAEAGSWGAVRSPFEACLASDCSATEFRPPIAPLVAVDPPTTEGPKNSFFEAAAQAVTARMTGAYGLWGYSQISMETKLLSLMGASRGYRELHSIGATPTSNIRGLPSEAEIDRTVADHGIVIAERYAEILRNPDTSPEGAFIRRDGGMFLLQVIDHLEGSSNPAMRQRSLDILGRLNTTASDLDAATRANITRISKMEPELLLQAGESRRVDAERHSLFGTNPITVPKLSGP